MTLIKYCLALIGCIVVVFIIFTQVALYTVTTILLIPYNLYLNYKYGSLPLPYGPHVGFSETTRFCPFRNHAEGKPLLYIIR